MKYFFATLALATDIVSAFPFVSNQAGVDSSLFRRQQSGGANPGGPLNCPYNPWAHHVPAAPITDQYSYNGTKNGVPGKGVGGYKSQQMVTLPMCSRNQGLVIFEVPAQD